MKTYLPDEKTTYIPLDPRPDDLRPTAGEAPYSGLRLVRVRTTSVGTDTNGLPAGRRAPINPERPTAASTNLWRDMRPDELPVPHPMTAVELLTDDARWGAFHGKRIRGDYAELTDTRGADSWRGGTAQNALIRIGGVLVSRRGSTWAIWRVLPGGPGAVLEAVVSDDIAGRGRAAVAAAVDRDLGEAFAEAEEAHRGTPYWSTAEAPLARWRRDAGVAEPVHETTDDDDTEAPDGLGAAMEALENEDDSGTEQYRLTE